MVLPSGDHSKADTPVLEEVSGLASPPSALNRNTWFSPFLFDRKASCFPSGDHFGLFSDFAEFVYCLVLLLLRSKSQIWLVDGLSALAGSVTVNANFLPS